MYIYNTSFIGLRFYQSIQDKTISFLSLDASHPLIHLSAYYHTNSRFWFRFLNTVKREKNIFHFISYKYISLPS